MSEDTMKSLINLVPESIDNVAKNLTDKPTQNMGTTLADIWYLVFGGISQAAEKRKLKYAHDLQEFNNELQHNVSNIPKNKLIEPDIQIVAPALEASKYCIGKEELRHMFANIITSSMNSEKFLQVHPLFVHTVSNLSILEAKYLMHSYYKFVISFISPIQIMRSISTLESLNIIKSMDYSLNPVNMANPKLTPDTIFSSNKIINIIGDITEDTFYNLYGQVREELASIYPDYNLFFHQAQFTEFGRIFKKTCITETPQSEHLLYSEIS